MNALLVFGFGLAALLATVWVLGRLCASIGDRLPARWGRSSSLRAALALCPVAIAVAVAVSLLSPQKLFGGCHCISHPHHLHLCVEHAAFSWALLIAAAGGLVGLVKAARAASRLVADHRASAAWLAGLRGQPAKECARVEIVEDPGTFAGTVGVVRPRIIVGSTLWSRLDEDTRRAIAAHEEAHVQRRDGLTLLSLRIAACFMSADSGERLVNDWRRAAEIAADRHAARKLGDPCAVASALVACGRIQVDAGPAGALGATDDNLELRVRCLLEADPRSSASRADAGGDLFGALAVMTALGTSLAALGGHGAHHAVETLLGWIS